MRQDEFAHWAEDAIRGYADEHVRAGDWRRDEALDRSQREFGTLLAEGLATPGHHLFTIEATTGGEAVGMIWVAEQGDSDLRRAFVYNIEIFEEHRRKGYGRASMLALEETVRGMGLSRIALHVFGHNKAALRLYEGVGYRVAHVTMDKEI